MNIKKRFTRISTFILLLTACACIKDNDFQDQLPPITQTGENTFGCVIDGEVLIPKKGSNGILLT